jgi:hypothetical protein
MMNMTKGLRKVKKKFDRRAEERGASLSSRQPPSGGLIPPRSPCNRHTILISHGNPAAEAGTARAGNRHFGRLSALRAHTKSAIQNGFS